jgi:hypothetical protein
MFPSTLESIHLPSLLMLQGEQAVSSRIQSLPDVCFLCHCSVGSISMLIYVKDYILLTIFLLIVNTNLNGIA